MSSPVYITAWSRGGMVYTEVLKTLPFTGLSVRVRPGLPNFNKYRTMKLYQVIQWGNATDGGDGWDTQCIVSGQNVQSAVEKGEFHLERMSPFKPYRNGKADVVYELGQDNRPDGEAILITPCWIKSAFNLTHNPAWLKDDSGKWNLETYENAI